MGDPLRILHLEDTVRDAELVRETLAAEGLACEIVRVDTRESFVSAVQAGGFDLILADYSLPAFDGISAQEIALERLPDTPFIFVSGTFGEELAVERVKAGATDYVLKERLSRLGPCIRRALREADDRRQRKRAEAELRRLNAELEARVRARTVELHGANLELARQGRELSEAKAFLDDLLAASPSIMFRLEPRDLSATYASPNVGWLLGYSPEEFVGTPDLWQQAIHADDRSRVLGELRSALERQVVQLEQEYRMQARDGRHRWIYGLTRIEYSESGAPVAVLGYALDIADRKAAEEALREHERFLDSVVENLPTMLFVKDARHLRFVRVNRAGEELLGYTREELRGKNDHDFFDAAQADSFTSKDREVLQGRAVVDIPEEPIRTRAGGARLLHTRKIPICDERGEPRYLLGISEDITDRRAAERALAESEQLLQALLDNSPAVIFIKDLDGRYVLVNRRFETLFHTMREAVRGKTSHDLFPPVLADQYRDNDAKVRASGHALEVEEIVAQDDGVHVYFSSRFPLHDGGGQMYAICGIAADITARKMAEEEAKMARLEAEQANRAKSEFLSRMSHDLRTPLNAILGFAQLLQTDALSPDERECVSQILNAGEHLLGLINQVLDLARIEAGHLSLSPEPVSAADVVERAVDLVGPIAARRRVVVHNDVTAADDIHVVADRQRLSQILLNLLSNAVKYNRDGGDVAVACERVGSDRVQIRVRDTGSGIAPYERDRLFRPFERLGADQTGIEGAGLGLSVSKELAQAMGGTLDFQSEVGRGSTFWVELPRASAPARLASAAAAPGADTRAPNRDITGTVLYVDDNRSNARLLERILARRPGVRLVPAALGGEGLSLARRERPDLVLLDLHLPDMHGEDVLRALTVDPGTKDIPVAILSADAMPGQTERLLAAGARAYLTKPLNIADVLRLIDQTLSGPQPRTDKSGAR